MKKNKHKYFIIIMIILSFIFLIPAHADSGWDSSYSGGYSGGSSWSSSSSSSYSGGSFGPIGSIIFIIIGVPLIILAHYNKGKNLPKTAPYDATNYEPDKPIPPIKISSKKKNTDVSFYKKVSLTNGELQKYKEQTFDIYKKIQTAWMDFDYDTLRKYTTDELYNLYHTQLIALKAKKQQNIMKDFNLTSFNVVNLEQNDNSITLTVRMTVECYDYVVDKDQKVVRGTDKRKNIYNYEMTFIKGIDTVDNKCPNCNAPLENVNSSVCPYCDSTIINDNHDYVLSKKQMLNQRQK